MIREDPIQRQALIGEILVLKEDECAQLPKQNQDLFEKLTKRNHDYQLVCQMHDALVAQNGAATTSWFARCMTPWWRKTELHH